MTSKRSYERLRMGHQGFIAGYRISYRDTQGVEYQVEREGKQVQRGRTGLSWL